MTDESMIDESMTDESMTETRLSPAESLVAVVWEFDTKAIRILAGRCLMQL